MLVFVQKTGAGLFLHNLLHTESAAKSSPQDNKGREFSYACSCIDDFLMPMTAAEEPDYFFAVPAPVSRIIAYCAPVPFVSVTHTSLRGPPAIQL